MTAYTSSLHIVIALLYLFVDTRTSVSFISLFSHIYVSFDRVEDMIVLRARMLDEPRFTLRHSTHIISAHLHMSLFQNLRMVLFYRSLFTHIRFFWQNWRRDSAAYAHARRAALHAASQHTHHFHSPWYTHTHTHTHTYTHTIVLSFLSVPLPHFTHHSFYSLLILHITHFTHFSCGRAGPSKNLNSRLSQKKRHSPPPLSLSLFLSLSLPLCLYLSISLSHSFRIFSTVISYRRENYAIDYFTQLNTGFNL